MRLATTIFWLIGTLLWLPWALLVLRLALDLALLATPWGHSWNNSAYAGPVADMLLVQFRWPDLVGWHLAGGYFIARVGSLYPWCALAGCALTALGWRLYWINEEGLLNYGPGAIAASILLPPLAPLMMYRDARRRYFQSEAQLAAARVDAQRRMERR
jgi:hypothetical protein